MCPLTQLPSSNINSTEKLTHVWGKEMAALYEIDKNQNNPNVYQQENR